MPLTDARLSRMRTRGNRYLAGSAIISGATRVSDGMGGWTETFAAIGTVSAYLQAHSQSEMAEQSGRMEVFTTYTLHIAHDGTIAAGQRVTYDSRTYMVESVIEPDTWRGFKAAALTLEDA